jgi:hypothetical protein
MIHFGRRWLACGATWINYWLTPMTRLVNVRAFLEYLATLAMFRAREGEPLQKPKRCA